MSFRERRERDEQRARERALVGMRYIVISALARFVQTMGSAAIFDAVDAALAQLIASARHLGDPEGVKGLWITMATCRLIDEQRSADVIHREPVAVEEHAQALAVSVSGELGQLTEDGRQWWRVQEILDSVGGELRRWADAYLRRVVAGSLKVGAQPRGLSKELGWTASKTKDVSERARVKMAAFIGERASGSVCADRQALLDSFIATSRGHGQDAALDEERFVAVVAHVGGCEECWLAWRDRRRTLLGRVAGVLALPVDVVGWAARKVHELAGGVDVATLSVRQRLGLGGGASAAAAGGGAATVGTKAAAVCAAAVCAAGAGGELVGVVVPIVSKSAQHEPRKHHARQHARPARQVVRPANVVAPTPVSPARPPAQAPSVAETAAAPEERFTPGDLPPASSTSPTGSSADSTGSSAPGDLPSVSSTSSGGSSAGSPSGGLGTPAPPPAPPPASAAGGGGGHCVLGELGC
jgi:hypothetical protein